MDFIFFSIEREREREQSNLQYLRHFRHPLALLDHVAPIDIVVFVVSVGRLMFVWLEFVADCIEYFAVDIVVGTEAT